MNELNEILTEMNFNFFSSGEHGMGIEAMRKVLGNDHFVFLDVRSNQEVNYVSFPFAIHIPLNELPQRLGELSKDKFVITFCSSVFRGAVAYAFLRANGFKEVKGLTASLEEMVKAFKPGSLAKIGN
jgi:rhodanese-related sulfurtransferase